MDIQSVAAQLIEYLGKNPELIAQFIKHPYSTTAQATSSDERISKQDMSQVVTAAAALSTDQQLDQSQVATIASALLGQNDNSVHSLTSMLFGGTATDQTKAAQGGSLDLGSLVNMAGLAAQLMGGTGGTTAARQPAVDLSDGLDLGEIATLAGQFLGGGSTTKATTSKKQASSQPAEGIDFGTIAQLANAFLKQQR